MFGIPDRVIARWTADGGESSHTFSGNDTLVAAIPWKKRRTILVFLREFSGRSFLLLRDFQRHRVLGRWYPGRRFFTLPIERADAVGRALIAAANGQVPNGGPGGGGCWTGVAGAIDQAQAGHNAEWTDHIPARKVTTGSGWVYWPHIEEEAPVQAG